MSEKCFCHFNGYAVKDATARKEIENVKSEIEDVKSEIEDVEGMIPDDLISSFDTLVTPQMFGAKGDGVTDDSQAIINAIASLPKENAVLYFPAGLYIHGDGTTTGESYGIKAGTGYQPDVTKETANVGRDIRFYFDGFKNLTIIGYGAEIRSNDGNGQTRNNAMFVFTDCEGVKIKGLTLNARREERGVVQDDYFPGAVNEFTQGNITFAYRCNDIVIEDVTSINSVHDGIGIGWTVNNVKIINCICDNAQRNGISICGCKNVLIKGCQCNNNGGSGTSNITGKVYRGIAPKCGIDIEGHPTNGNIIEYPNINIHIENCIIEGNHLGFSIFREGHNVNIEKCYIKNNTHLSVTDDGTSSELCIRECNIINSRLYSGFTVIENNTIEQHYNGGELTNGFSFDGMDTANNPNAKHLCKDNTFKFIIDDESAVEDDAYMGIRLNNNTEFVGNKIVGAFSVCDICPLIFNNTYLKNNIFERKYTSINGIDATTGNRSVISLSGNYTNNVFRENNEFGDYLISASKDFNQTIITDTTITKSYCFTGNLTGRMYKIPCIGITKIKASYFGQEEEVIIPDLNRTRFQHILKTKSHAGEFTANSILNAYFAYIDGTPYAFIKINVPYPKFTCSREMDYIENFGKFKNFFTEEFLINVTDEVNAGTIVVPGSSGINMIRESGDNNSRPNYGNVEIGSMYYDTVLKRPLFWINSKWVDYEGNDLTNFSAFTVDGIQCIYEKNGKFVDWVKSKHNHLRLRLADEGNDPLVVSPDGNKTLYVLYEGVEVSVRGSHGIFDINNSVNPGVYYWKETPGVNPNYSKTPVFWNGKELVTATLNNNSNANETYTLTIIDTSCPSDPETYTFEFEAGMTWQDFVNKNPDAGFSFDSDDLVEFTCPALTVHNINCYNTSEMGNSDITIEF